MGVCEDCAAATDAMVGREQPFVTLAGSVLTEQLLGHQRCIERMKRQREILPFALSSCTCQHRGTPRPLGTLTHDSGEGFGYVDVRASIAERLARLRLQHGWERRLTRTCQCSIGDGCTIPWHWSPALGVVLES